MLHYRAVKATHNDEMVRLRDFVSRDHPGSARPGSEKVLALGQIAFQLPIADGAVIEACVACDVGEGFVRPHVPGASTNHGDQLSLPIKHFGEPRALQWRFVPNERSIEFQEGGGMLR